MVKNNTFTGLWSFFSKMFFWALLLILAGEILDSILSNYQGHARYWINILSKMSTNIGLAIFVANIFNFILGTESFISYIRDKLIKIIISKDFIKRLNSNERKVMLKDLLKPGHELSKIYSGINDYFDNYISESMLLFNSHYRSGFVINASVKKCNKCNKVTIESDMNYRIYKVMGEFENLPIYFESSDSKILSTKVTAPDGTEESLTENEVIETEKVKSKHDIADQTVPVGSTQSIPTSMEKYKHLDISRKILEYGEDHWQLFTYRASQPCDKIQITITCFDNLEVKNCVPFGQSKKFKIENDKTKIIISCNGWLKPGFGVAVLVAEKSKEQS